MPRKEPRNYKAEYKEYHGKPEQVKNRASRNKSRAIMEKKGKVHKGDGKEVDHKNGNPRKLKGNLQVLSRTANRKKGG
jgi:hypothetical protein